MSVSGIGTTQKSRYLKELTREKQNLAGWSLKLQRLYAEDDDQIEDDLQTTYANSGKRKKAGGQLAVPDSSKQRDEASGLKAEVKSDITSKTAHNRNKRWLIFDAFTIDKSHFTELDMTYTVELHYGFADYYHTLCRLFVCCGPALINFMQNNPNTINSHHTNLRIGFRLTDAELGWV